MARRNRRRTSQAWAVQGDPETVQAFSLHRMIETLSAHQLGALEAIADMHKVQLQFQAFIAALGASAAMYQRQLDTLETVLSQLLTLDATQRTMLLNVLRSLSALPPVQPPASG